VTQSFENTNFKKQKLTSLLDIDKASS